MNSLHQIRLAVCVGATAALLAGCGGAGAGVGGPLRMQPGLLQRIAEAAGGNHDRSGSEVLTATSMQIMHSGASCRSIGPSSSWTNSFTTFGNATGVMPGEFKSGGQWTVSFSNKVETWSFSQSITIRSGTTFVTASVKAGSPDSPPKFTCHPRSFGPARFKYTLQNGGGGKIRIKALALTDFNEELLNFTP